jgi:hypothetical protein
LLLSASGALAERERNELVPSATGMTTTRVAAAA